WILGTLVVWISWGIWIAALVSIALITAIALVPWIPLISWIPLVPPIVVRIAISIVPSVVRILLLVWSLFRLLLLWLFICIFFDLQARGGWITRQLSGFCYNRERVGTPRFGGIECYGI